MNESMLLTGANGFVGQQVLKSLRTRQISVRLVLREPKQQNIGKAPKSDDVVFTTDLFKESAEWWTQHCKNIDIVTHVAWYAEPGKYLQSSKNLDCLQGTLDLARGAVAAGVKRFIGIGTCFEYDVSAGFLTTETPLKPKTLYAASKVATYQVLKRYFEKNKVEFCWCRLFYLYGEGEDSRRLVPYVHQQLANGQVAELTSGNQIRDFIDVREAGEMIVKAALGDATGAVNICSGAPVTVRQLVEQIADFYGRRDLLEFGIREDNVMDPACVVGCKSDFKD